jgi:hypothetical protein
METLKFKKVNSWDKTKLYQASLNGNSANIEAEQNSRGGYYCYSSFGDFEANDVKEIKTIITNKLRYASI